MIAFAEYAKKWENLLHVGYFCKQSTDKMGKHDGADSNVWKC